jgi:hypothetical protein
VPVLHKLGIYFFLVGYPNKSWDFGTRREHGNFRIFCNIIIRTLVPTSKIVPTVLPAPYNMERKRKEMAASQ